ncbi:MAG TPA: ABC transporter substrate-binding protein, partial [Acidobacteriota bacterium]|nr:ABC transporter substrate-binding protein [Acidobacteriota bacterium]
PAPKSGGAVHLGIAAKLTELDPALAQYVTIFEWVYNFFEGLVEFGEGTDIRPCLAERWEISEDGLTYTFKLKRGVRFHNGKELTALDVRDSFQRALHPLTKSPGTWAFEMIEGAEEFRKGNASEISGVNVIDPVTLKVRLSESVPFFLGMIAQPFAYVMPSELAKRYGPLVDVIGTGPFKLDRFIPDERIEMSRFDGYHNPPIPYLQRVVAEFGLTESEIADGIRSGKFHYTSDLQKQYLSEFLVEPEWRPRLQTNVQLYTAFLAMSCRIPPLHDVRVRQAIAYAIDRERIVRDIVGAEQAVIARTLLPPGLPGHDPNAIGYPYDPVRSRSLLNAARIAEGTRLETWHGEAGSNLAVLRIIQENLKDVGIDLQIREVDPDVQNQAIEQGVVPIRMTRWLADYPDPDNFLYVTFHSKSSVYNLGFENQEFDRLVQDARTLADLQERVRLYQRAEKIWMQECHCVCLYHNRALVLHQENVQGCVPHFTQPAIRLKKIWLSR